MKMLQRFLTTRVSKEKNKGLVANLKRYGVIRSPKVAEVMVNIDRGFFVPDENTAYADRVLMPLFLHLICVLHALSCRRITYCLGCGHSISVQVLLIPLELHYVLV